MKTFKQVETLSREDVKKAYLTSQLMSSFDQAIDVLHEHLNEKILDNKETNRQYAVARWIKEEKEDRAEEKRKVKEWNKTHKDIEDMWLVSPPPHAMTFRGTTICGWCLGRKEEAKPKKGCYRHYWDLEGKKK